MRRRDFLGAAMLIVAAAMTTEAAVADATWFCAAEGSITKYRVAGKEMTDLTDAAFMKRWGVDMEPGKYQVLKDTPQGIVAVRSQATERGDSDVSVSVSVILINKQTGVMRELFFSTEQLERDRSVRGHCEPG